MIGVLHIVFLPGLPPPSLPPSQVKDLRERLEEAESIGVRKMKAQLQAMENRAGSLEEQLDAATRSVDICPYAYTRARTRTHTHTHTQCVVCCSSVKHYNIIVHTHTFTNAHTHTNAHRERAQAHRTLRRQDKKMKELAANIDDERKQGDAYKSDADKAISRMRSLKRGVEEAEEENARLTAARRRLQREVDELTEQNESLNRELQSARKGYVG